MKIDLQKIIDKQRIINSIRPFLEGLEDHVVIDILNDIIIRIKPLSSCINNIKYYRHLAPNQVIHPSLPNRSLPNSNIC